MKELDLLKNMKRRISKKKYFNEFLQYLDISEKHFWNVVDSWRPKHLWKKNNSKWVLKNPIFR